MSNDEKSTRLRKIVDEICLYLMRNPEAKDTVQGIRQWWIPHGEERFSGEEVQSALELMATRAWMKKSRLAGTVSYGATENGLVEFRVRAKGQRQSED